MYHPSYELDSCFRPRRGPPSLKFVPRTRDVSVLHFFSSTLGKLRADAFRTIPALAYQLNLATHNKRYVNTVTLKVFSRLPYQPSAVVFLPFQTLHG